MSTADEVKAMLAEQANEPRRYVKAVGPRLRILLYIVFVFVAVLGANSIYLAGVTSSAYLFKIDLQDYFFTWMSLLHVVLGLLFVVPFVAFGTLHLVAARKRRNRRAVKIGYTLFIVSIVLLTTGVLLTRALGIDLKHPTGRSIVYWLHVISPIVAIWLYWLHRLAGPRIKWNVGRAYALVVFVIIGAMIFFQFQDPRNLSETRYAPDKNYFHPSLTSTVGNKFLSGHSMMDNKYCMQCHKDVYDDWYHSAHRFSSFNNPAYLASIRNLRKFLLKRDGNIQASRWCAGCHDPVPLFTGAFDQPDYDDVNDPTSQAGITCMVCHGMVEINARGVARGNGDYVMDEPIHYPFAYSKNPILKFINSALIKSKPNFHKRTFLKPFHKQAEFCSTCHKVHLPKELTAYKDFLRGQNHYDAFLLSGVSGVGIRSFYYPPKAQPNCNECHMPPRQSSDFAAKELDDTGELKVHNHSFPSANTAVAWWQESDKMIQAHKDFLKDVMRVDIFGIKEDASITGKLHAPLRPQIPTLEPGKQYLLETVIRTMKMGHLFTQGTVDSNEVWLEVTVKSGDRIIGRSGALDKDREVDKWSHFVNAFVIDRDGNRIARRNAQDIFLPLYNHQIPPGAAQTVHYRLAVPPDIKDPIHVELKLNYRKFDKEYMDFIAEMTKEGDNYPRNFTRGQPYKNELPIVELARDELTFPVAGGNNPASINDQKSKIIAWQRWNDYGIGLLLKGRGELRQAEVAFKEVEKLKRFDGPMNLARVYISETRWTDAIAAINRARKHDNPAAYPWTLNWLSGQVNRGQGHFDEAAKNFRAALNYSSEESRRRGFDFRRDYVVRNLLGSAIYDQALRIVLEEPEKLSEEQLKQLSEADRKEYEKEQRDYRKLKSRRDVLIGRAIEEFKRTLAVDDENFTAHHNLHLLYQELGLDDEARTHQELHERYKPDETATSAKAKARAKYPWANHAAEALVIYNLQRKGATGLPIERGAE